VLENGEEEEGTSVHGCCTTILHECFCRRQQHVARRNVATAIQQRARAGYFDADACARSPPSIVILSEGLRKRTKKEAPTFEFFPHEPV
jgi:hypothetical protein